MNQGYHHDDKLPQSVARSYRYNFDYYPLFLYQYRVTRLSTEHTYRPTTANGVEVYLEPEDVPYNFERSALIKTETVFEMDNTLSIKTAKKEAASVGGNAIILREYQYPEDEDGTSKVGTMVAIYISDLGCS